MAQDSIRMFTRSAAPSRLAWRRNRRAVRAKTRFRYSPELRLRAAPP